MVMTKTLSIALAMMQMMIVMNQSVSASNRVVRSSPITVSTVHSHLTDHCHHNPPTSPVGRFTLQM